MNNQTQNYPLTYEGTWAAIQETHRVVKEAKEAAEKDRKDYERRMKKMEELVGSWSNNHGSFAEEYFFNSFENGQQNFFGEKLPSLNK